MNTRPPTTVLVIDDSAHNRRTLKQLLESEPDVQVLDWAVDGEEGLRKVVDLRPDVVTVDLEMPRMGGYTFLRLLRSAAPTPAIVISSHTHKADVFKALELGAFDFIARPAKPTPQSLEELRTELLEKVRAARLVRRGGPRRFPSRLPRDRETLDPAPLVVAVGASTGGPPAVQRLLEALAVDPSFCVLICQHMPSQFTKAFADRLDSIGPFHVSEAKDGDRLEPGHVFIAPGGRHMLLVEHAGQLVLKTPEVGAKDRYVPSVDRLFTSVAKAMGHKSLAVVLTGMGSDGAAGAKDVHHVGGEVWAESEETAVVFGMPQEAISTGVVKRVLPLGEIGPALLTLARRRR